MMRYVRPAAVTLVSGVAAFVLCHLLGLALSLLLGPVFSSMSLWFGLSIMCAVALISGALILYRQKRDPDRRSFALMGFGIGAVCWALSYGLFGTAVLVRYLLGLDS